MVPGVVAGKHCLKLQLTYILLVFVCVIWVDSLIDGCSGDPQDCSHAKVHQVLGDVCQDVVRLKGCSREAPETKEDLFRLQNCLEVSGFHAFHVVLFNWIVFRIYLLIIHRQSLIFFPITKTIFSY